MNKEKIYNCSVIPTVVSLDELFEKTDQGLIKGDWQYKYGAYDELDTDVKGEIANIFRLMENNSLPPQEKRAIEKTLEDEPLNMAERKAKERAVKRLKELLRINFY